MDKMIMTMFLKQPDEIINNDYFYLPYCAEWSDKIEDLLGVSYKENLDRIEASIRSGFKLRWEYTDIHCNKTSPCYEPWIRQTEAAAIITKIATEGKPFMDIASGKSMGLAPYIIKMNPEIPCLVTDINATIIKTLRSCIDEHLPEFNISLACFDNLDMPLKDNSLDYITSRYGVLSSVPKRENIYQYSSGSEKPISEVYRVLKPGGQFVTIEENIECDFDLQRLYEYCDSSGSFMGVYSFEEMRAVLDLLVEEPWRDKFEASGFEPEYENKYYRKYEPSRIMSFLHEFTRYHGIRKWEKLTWREELNAKSVVWNSDYEAKHASDSGLDLFEVAALYVLRKP